MIVLHSGNNETRATIARRTAINVNSAISAARAQIEVQTIEVQTAVPTTAIPTEVPIAAPIQTAANPRAAAHPATPTIAARAPTAPAPMAKAYYRPCHHFLPCLQYNKNLRSSPHLRHLPSPDREQILFRP